MRRKIGFISVLLAQIILLSQLELVYAEKYFQTDSIIEAENTTLNNGMSFYVNDYVSGRGVYSTSPNISDARSITAEDISFLFSVPQDGEYHIYMKCYLPSSYNSFFFRVDNGKWQYVDYGPMSNNNYEWVELDCVSFKAGTHKCSYNHAKSNDIDAFYITQNPKTLPEITKDEEEDDEETLPEIKNVASYQKEVPHVTGNGILIEAEDVTYQNTYQLASNKLASGGKALRANATYPSGTVATRRGDLEVDFIPDSDGSYVIWGRLYAEGGNQDSLYASFTKQGYDFRGFEEVYQEFHWVKLGTKYLKKGEKETFRMYPRERGHLVDAFIITSTSVVPTGRMGNLPTGKVKSVLVSKHEPTPIKPPTEHPRVLFTSADIPRIKANMEKAQNLPAVESLNALKAEVVDGMQQGNYNEELLRRIEAFAFDYIINGNKESGKIAVSAIINYLNTSDVSGGRDNVTRSAGTIIYRASEVYDWCYDLLTSAQKANIIERCEYYANKMEIEWPPERQGSLVGHGAEAQLLRDALAFAIATYNERPDIWEEVGGRFFEEYVPGRDFFNKGHFALQGDSYGLYRHRWDTWSNILIKGMGYDSPYNEEDLSKVGYSQIYLRRPDGQYMRYGDTSFDTENGMWAYWGKDYSETYMLDATMIKDPYLKDEVYALGPEGKGFYYASPIIFLVFNDPDFESASVSNLPKSKFFPDPAGVMVARTGWDRGAESSDVVCEMKIGGVQQNGHQHLDSGHFQIYYKGILASDSGVYQGLINDNSVIGGTGFSSPHRSQYMIKTIAHNSMLVYDPDESTGAGTIGDIADGGQRNPSGGSEPWDISVIEDAMDNWRVAEVKAQEIDPENPIDPEYTYIKGDLTNAYTDKVQEFKRSFMFFNFFDNEVPAALIVFDKVTSSDAGFKKTWLLHGVEKPTVNGMQTVFSRTYQSPITPCGYNGKMTVDTMLPKAEDANISIVGGEEEGFSIVNGKDITGYPSASHTDEGNTYRMELSPKSSKKTDYFLNVIQVSDNDKQYYLKPSMLEADKFYGIKIKDRAVFFSKSADIVSESFSLDVQSECKVTICDVKSGAWNVVSDGKTQTVIASEDGCLLSFDAHGKIECSYVGAGEKETVLAPEIGTKKEINLRIEGRYVKCPADPEIKNGKATLPLSTISSWFDLSKEENEDRIILKSDKTQATISKTDADLRIGDITYDMGVIPYEKDGELMVPVRDIVEAFGGEVLWFPLFSLISLTLPPADYSLPKEGYAIVAKVSHDPGAIDGNNVAENAVDGDGDTIWAAFGKGRYIDIELDKVYSIDRVEILFNPNSGRNAEFEIQISEDGEDYQTVISSKSDGSLEGVAWEYYYPKKVIKTKYIRYMANGSNISDWNAIKEIRFRKG